jgi:hypothetical protein
VGEGRLDRLGISVLTSRRKVRKMTFKQEEDPLSFCVNVLMRK